MANAAAHPKPEDGFLPRQSMFPMFHHSRNPRCKVGVSGAQIEGQGCDCGRGGKVGEKEDVEDGWFDDHLLVVGGGGKCDGG